MTHRREAQVVVESKVQNLLDGLREEESRLDSQLSEAEARVKELRAEVERVQAGIKALTGKDGGRKKRSRRAATRRSQGASDTGQNESVPAEHDMSLA